MAEASFSKLSNVEPLNYIYEIRQMMHGFGDSDEPIIESAKIIEEVVLQQMRVIVKKAYDVAERRADMKKVSTINGEDLLFLLRKDKVKLRRLIRYLEIKDLGCSVNKIVESDTPENFVDPEQVNGVDRKVPFQSFLNQIDNLNNLLENMSSMDDIKQLRCIRMDMATKSMDEVRYMKFSKARRVSFANKNRHKFSDWICLDGDITLSKQAYTILGYLAYETVAQIVDFALLVRQDQNKIYGDAIDRQRLRYVNSLTYKPYYHGKNVATKPLTPLEITEALRRYWSPQLAMTGPFNRWSMRRPHLKLLSC